MGRAITELFSKEGAKVVVGEWNQTTLDEVVNAVKSAGGEVVGCKIDVSVQAQAESLIDAAVSAFGRVDVLVNNAGVMDNYNGVGEMPDDIWQRVMGINLNGPMYLMRKAIPLMVAQGGGAVVNVASVAGMGGAAAGAAYTVSKHGLVGLTRNTAWRYAKDNVRCNAIAAGAVETTIQNSMDMARLDQLALSRATPYHQVSPAYLKPFDIANLALFLASDEARYINGAIVPADGGWLAA
jgi:NAD(P)-dependent dehydrogenase (short-subunit alcohol dehydrogenase family)